MLCLLMLGASLMGNPLEMACYEQEFTLDFSDEKAARGAELKARGLPGNYVLAISSRWDDADNRHLNTHRIMKKYGAKGNFYINGGMARDLSLLDKILRDGCCAGAHTVGHHPIKHLAANEHFYEYMANRIAVEVKGQSPVNTQTSPYGHIRGLRKEGTESIGRSLISAGIIGSPDSSSPNHTCELGYPKNSCAFMYRITPGDRVPDMKKFETLLNTYLQNPALKNNPGISMSTHSWHTEEGLKILDEMYRRLTMRKDWWQCSQNEYAAYRYEALNTTVKKEVTGKTVKFTVTRFEPFELGADVPLYLDIIGAEAIGAKSAKLTNGGKQVMLPHRTGSGLPEKYGCNQLDGIKLELKVSESDGRMTALVSNTCGKQLESVTLTFRLPPKYGKLVARTAPFSIDKEAKVTKKTGDILKKSRHFTEGKAYFAVQMDYIADGKRCRLYADTFGKEVKFSKLQLNDALVCFERPKNWNDAQKLSLPGEDAAKYGLKPLKSKRSMVCTSGAAYPGKVSRAGFIGFAEFTAQEDTRITARVHAGKNIVLYLNGNKLKNSPKAVLKLRKGTNRILVSSASGGSFVFDADVNYTACGR